MGKIILFDGECNFCSQIVQFIIKRDPKGAFRFTSLQSVIGKELLSTYNAPEDIDSLVLIEDGKCYFMSSAALRIFKDLTGAWKLTYFFLMVPKPMRDFFYRIIAKNRYKLYSKKDRCMVPTPEERKRFL